jgi:hypothetical protein
VDSARAAAAPTAAGRPPGRSIPCLTQFRRPSADRQSGETPLPLSLPEDVCSSPTPAPTRQRLFVAEIACLLCGRPVGTAMAESWPPCGPVVFRPADSTTERQLPAVSSLRCSMCGGSAVVDELSVLTLRLEPPIDWRAERPRRGRPPKWLAQQRQAAESDTAEDSGEPVGSINTRQSAARTRCNPAAYEPQPASKPQGGINS